MNERHVKFTELGLLTAETFGHPKQTKTLVEILIDPPLAASMTEKDLLSMLVYQQSAVIQLLRDELKAIRSDVSAIRRDLKHAQTRVAAAREKAAKAEEKAAKARERAAEAEIRAAAEQEPTVLIQAGAYFRKLEPQIRRKF